MVEEISELLDVKQAQKQLLERFCALEEQEVELRNAFGRVLSRDVLATHNLPSFPNSSMDGFAVQAGDVASASRESPSQLRVVSDIQAGQMSDGEIRSGQAARIMTGAPIPEGADAVVPVENTDFNYRKAGVQAPKYVKVYNGEAAGANIRPAGEDVRKGEVVLHSGKPLGPHDLGLLSMLGFGRVPVHRKPRVAVFSSGNELLPVDAPLVPGKIHDANRPMLLALIEQLGGVPLDLGIVLDEFDAVQAILDRAVVARVDLILSSAGVSVGAFDFVREVVETRGRLEFWRVNMRPGKPLAFGEYQGVPFVGLPGNPVSAYIGFLVFVRPAIEKMLGLDGFIRTTQRVKLMEPVESDGREAYLRVVVSLDKDEFTARLTGHQGSGNLRSLVQANALLLVPSGVKSMPAGTYGYVWFIADRPLEVINRW